MDVTNQAERRRRMAALESRIRLYEKLGDMELDRETYVADLKEMVRLRRIDRAEGNVLYFI